MDSAPTTTTTSPLFGQPPGQRPVPGFQPPATRPAPAGGLPPVSVQPLPGATPPAVPEHRPDPAADQPPTKRKRWPRWLWRILAVLLAPVLLLQVYAFIVEAGYTAPRTAYMLQSKEHVVYQFVSLDHMSRFLLASTIAHEDERLGSRAGAFDWADLQARAAAYMRGEPDPSGSTIPQQLVKNMFLWEERENPTALRKALEAGLATQYAYTLDDKRVLELYLNYAQFGPGLYGACAASWYYFDTPPWNMTEYQSAQLMGVLPLPDLVRRAPDGGIDLGPNANRKAWDLINGAANVWVPQQLDGMGGWKAAAATVGITDTASDHADTLGNDDACSTMPDSVKERLAADFG